MNYIQELIKDIVDQFRVFSFINNSIKYLLKIIYVKLEIAKRPVGGNQNQSFKLPDDFGDKMEEIRKLKALMEELKNNFSDVIYKIILMKKIFLLQVFFFFFSRKRTRE